MQTVAVCKGFWGHALSPMKCLKFGCSDVASCDFYPNSY